MESAKRWSTFLLLVLGVSVGCAQLIGADEPRELRRELTATDAMSDVFAVVPDASVDAQACAPTEKRCNNTCVPKTDPAYGCASEDCEPCNLPNAKTLACRESDGKCVAGTCRDGFASCLQPHLGCPFDFSEPATCGDCNVNCNNTPKPLCASTGCAATCPNGTTQCESSCVDLQVHPKYCGACNNACVPGANGDPACADAKCYTICRPGFAHCDNNPNGNCVALQTFYQDLDGDGFGDVNAPKKQACPGQGGPGWAPVAGDCNDNNKDVFPGQPQYFATAYKNTAGHASYDYDCNGVEQDRATHFPGCNEKCGGDGLGPAGAGRPGLGVNDYCGSTTSISCTGAQALDPNPALPQIHPMSSGNEGEVIGQCSLRSSVVGANPCR